MAPVFPSDSPKPLNKHLVNAASSQEPWPLLPRSAVPAGNAYPPCPKPPQFTDEKTEAKGPRVKQRVGTARIQPGTTSL